MKAWIIVTDDFKTYYAKEVEGEKKYYIINGIPVQQHLHLSEMVGFCAIQKGRLVPQLSDLLNGENAEFWLTKEACESAIRGVMG